MLQSAIEGMDTGVHLEKAWTEVLGEDRVTRVRFADGSELACDMLVVARDGFKTPNRSRRHLV